MTIAIEGIWKGGKIVPLEDIKVENDTKVMITIPEPKKDRESLLSLAGIWKNDDKTYETFRGVYRRRNEFKLRKWPSA